MSVRLELTFGRSTLLGLALGAVAVPAVLVAVTIPHTFTNGAVADATQMNANFGALGTAVTTLETTVAGNRLPVGTIVAWHKSFTGTPALPDGWAEANGQVVNDAASPYNGRTLPNLNGEARFLRGGATSGTLQAQQFETHGHGHDIRTNGGGAHDTGGQSADHTHEMWTSANFGLCGGSGIYRTTFDGDGSNACRYPTGAHGGGASQNHTHRVADHNHVMIGGVGAPNTGATGSETRPANMSVVWIVKLR